MIGAVFSMLLLVGGICGPLLAAFLELQIIQDRSIR